MTLTATDIVKHFLEKRGVDYLRLHENGAVMTEDGPQFTQPWLTAWVWHEFAQSPTQASIRSAVATLLALARENA
jgi:hypothetical protein